MENDFEKLNFATLMKINGLGKTHACQVLAAFESLKDIFKDGIKIQNANDVYKLVSDLKEKARVFCYSYFGRSSSTHPKSGFHWNIKPKPGSSSGSIR